MKEKDIVYLCTTIQNIINKQSIMKHAYYYLQIAVALSCFLPVMALAQSTHQSIPEALRGYWQFPTENVSEWNGPLIGETFVEVYYTVGYAEQMEKEADGNYLFRLRSNNGQTTAFRIRPLTGDSALIWYQNWKEPKRCVRRKTPSYTEMLSPTTLPDKVYQKWTIGLDGKPRYEFTREGKMLFDGKTWDILSAGYFLNKEYRLLVKSDDLYKLIYLSFPFPGMMKVAMELGNEQVIPRSTRSGIYDIAGYWRSEDTGNWLLAFFEDFAVYQCQFWDYESIHTRKGVSKVVLRSGSQHLNVEMKHTDSEHCTLRIGKEKPQTCTLLKGNRYPDYPQPDNTPFADNGYTTDSVTITGCLRCPPSRQPFEIALYDMVTDNEVKYTQELDSLGRFTLRFPVLNTHNVFIDWGRSSIWSIVEPGETYFLLVDFSGSQRFFMGKKARVLNELLGNEGLREYIDYEKGKKMSAEEYLKKSIEIQQHKQTYREKILKEHPLLSDQYRYYTEQDIRYTTASGLMQRRFSLNRRTKEKLPHDFIEYVDTTMYRNPVQPYTLVRDYNTFMRDYTGYIYDITDHQKYMYTGQEIADMLHEMEKAGKIKISAQENEDVTKWVGMLQEMKKQEEQGADSLTFARIRENHQELIDRMNKLLNSETFRNHLQEKMHFQDMQRQVEIIDSLEMDPMLRQILTACAYYGTLQTTHKEFPDSLIARLKEKVTNPSLLRYVVQRQQTYQTISNKKILHPESLKSNDALAGITDGEALLRKIIEPYQGKVIYLDVWGTWCGPCKMMMQYAGAAKKLFEGKDVIFLYLANHSSDASWKNIIKEYQLTGPTSVHYNLPEAQQEAIEQYLHIKSFPTYILIDKKGQIVTHTAPRPNESNELVNAVWKILEGEEK